MSHTPQPYYDLPSRSPGQTPMSPKPSGIRRFLSSTVLLGGIIACVLLASIGVSAAGGVVAGENERDHRATQTTTAELELQFNLGISDLDAGRYELAAQRFRWILDLDSDYPGVLESLAEAQRRMNEATISTQAPTLPPSGSANPEEIFSEAQGYFEAHQWENTITRLRELQMLDPRFREIEVKEMLYEALKSLGVSYIRGDRIEEGLFLLDEASMIRALDDQTEGERHLATLYATGQSYWDLNWPVVIQNFQVIYDTIPTYRDVADLLWEAHVMYGDQLSQQGSLCGAAEQYRTALEIRLDSETQEKYDLTAKDCASPTIIPTATTIGTSGPTPTAGPSPTGGPTPTGGVTLTPTPEWNIP